ncbi:MAG TPA: glutathione S-transferase family protein [Caulobacteraceae bacterium]|nr:glutathione S-transferase family protein [Caulobacteraceae bacterium]
MVTLHVFGPFMGAVDPSPFVLKAMALLRMAGVPYRAVPGNPLAAPHRFLPLLEHAGGKTPDSALIRAWIERDHGFDFDRGLTPAEKAIALAMQRLCEDHLYFAIVHARWCDDHVFAQGLGRHMFGAIPAPARPLIKAMLRRANAARLRGQGLGRHDPGQVAAFGVQDIDALAAFLGDKPYLMGAGPCGADASLFGVVEAILTPPLPIALRAAMGGHANLVAYRDRFARRYFPELFEPKLRAAA